jgi:CheY-like chemotaxis protein
LGLAAVLGIVRGHKGALKVYSELGRGTTIKLLLPSSGGVADALPHDPPPGVEWSGNGVVLLVDDEETVRSVTGRMLKTIGFEPMAATSGPEAIELYRKHGPQIAAVMLDLTMPQMDGGQTFSELRLIDPEVKVLLMSGFNEQDAINRFSGKGLSAFLQKPFKPQILRQTLRAMLVPGE